MDCHELPELCPDYHAGALEEAQAARYREHLALCEACRSADEEYRQGLELLMPWPVEPSSRSDREFLGALFAVAGRSGDPGSPGMSLLPSRSPRAVRRPRLVLGPLALAASLLIALAWMGWQDREALVAGQDAEALIAAALEQDDALAPWADLSGLEASLLEAQAELLGEASELDLPDLDPAGFEEGLWSELAAEAGGFEEPWPGDGPSLEEELDRLEPQELQRLVTLFEQG
jgi:hypothetical protein